jgi:hypothetical protein
MKTNENCKSTRSRATQARETRYRGALSSGVTLAGGRKVGVRGTRGKGKGTGEVLRIGTVNVGTMKGRSAEIAAMLKDRRLDFCCLQETRWRGGSAREIAGYKFFWIGCDEGVAGVGVMMAKKWVDSVIEVKRVNERILVIRVRVGKSILNLVSIYAPQVGRSMEVKEEFYVMLRKVIDGVPENEVLLIAGDFNGHVGEKTDGFEGIHGGRGFGSRNLEGEMLLEFAESMGLRVMNTWFEKEEERRVTYESGGCRTVVDYVLIRQRDRSMIMDVTVIRNEPCIPQHKLMICKLVLKDQIKRRKENVKSKCKVWRLKEAGVQKEFGDRVQVAEGKRDRSGGTVESIWTEMKECLLGAADEVCGRTKGRPRHQESWWWNDECAKAVAEKKRLFILKEESRKGEKLRAAEDKIAYERAKCAAKKVISRVKEAERKEWSESLEKENEKGTIFKVVKQVVRKNRDVVGGGCMKNGQGKVVVDEDEIKEVWRNHYEKLLNEEFEWQKDDLEADRHEVQVQENIVIEEGEVRAAIRRMKTDKAAGPTGVVAEMLKASGDGGVRWMTDLCNAVVKEGTIPNDWCKSWIVSVYKGKGDALECGSYRGIKLLEHAMKVLERVIEVRLRKMIDVEDIKLDDMQFGFRAGRGTIDAIFVVRQMQERYLQKKKELWMAFVDLEKAFDRVPRQVVWWALRQLGVGEEYIAVIKAMYAGAMTSVKVMGGESKGFEVKVGVHQGSILSPLLFIMVVEALSRRFRGSLPWELLYADDLVLIAESRDQLLKRIRVWKEGLEVRGLRVNVGKTKVMRCQVGSGKVVKSGKWPCGVCGKGVGRNSVECATCEKWIHMKCTNLKRKLKAGIRFECAECILRVTGGAVAEFKDEEIVLTQDSKLEMVSSFCYLGDMLGSGGGAGEATRTRIRCAWAKFHELSQFLRERGASLKLKGKIYRACVQSVLVYGSETWPTKVEDMQRLERTERMMVRWMCGVSLKDRCNTTVLRERLGIEEVAEVVRRGRLRWFGHVERKKEGDWVSACRKMEVVGTGYRGRGRKTWNEVIEDDMKKCGLKREMAKDREVWRRGICGKPSDPRKRGKGDVKR